MWIYHTRVKKNYNKENSKPNESTKWIMKIIIKRLMENFLPKHNRFLWFMFRKTSDFLTKKSNIYAVADVIHIYLQFQK